MSRQLAEKVLETSDMAQVVELLTKNRKELDEHFYNTLQEASNRHTQERKYDEAAEILEKLFKSGKIAQNPYVIASSFLLGAYVQAKRRQFEKSVRMARTCIEECDKTPDPRIYELKAEALRFLGQISHQQYEKHDTALQYLHAAVKLYEKLEKTATAETIRGQIAEIESQQTSLTAKAKPLSTILDEIEQSHRIHADLEKQIETTKSEIQVLEQQRDTLQSSVGASKG